MTPAIFYITLVKNHNQSSDKTRGSPLKTEERLAKSAHFQNMSCGPESLNMIINSFHSLSIK